MKRLLVLAFGTVVIAASLWLGYGTITGVAMPDRVVDVPKMPYDESADAHTQLDAALARAKAGHKRVLIKFGANWCPDCRVLAGAMEIPQIRNYVDRHFETVSIDVGRRTKNMDIAAQYGQTLKYVPTVVVLNADGTQVPGINTTALGDAREMKPQAILDVLKGWATAG